METRALPIACHGKLPSDREYVHHQVGPVNVAAWDRWVREGHRQAFLGRAAPGSGYDDAPPIGFAFSAPGASLWGVLASSRDATGRRYPFWAAWPAPSRPLVPSGFEAAQAFVERAVQGGVTPRALGREIERMSTAPPPSPLADAASREASMEAFLHHSLPAGSPLSPRQLVGAWMSVMAGTPADRLSDLRYGFQMPLPPPPPSDDRPSTRLTADAAFWADATRRLVGDPDLPLTLFWTLAPSDGPAETPPPFLLLFPSPPPTGVFAHLFAPTDDRPFVYAPAHAPPAQTDPSHVDAAIAALSPEHCARLNLSLSRSAFLNQLG